MTVYYKMRQILLRNATAILLQNATEVYYKMRRLLKIMTVHPVKALNNFVTKSTFTLLTSF